MHWRRKWRPTPVLLPGESLGQGSLVGCRLWGHTELDTIEVTWQQQEVCENFIFLSFIHDTEFPPKLMRNSHLYITESSQLGTDEVLHLFQSSITLFQ